MARPKEAELSAAFREKEAQERERLEARLARHLQEDMGRLFDEGTHADLTFTLPGMMVSAHSAIIKQRAPLLYNKYVRGANPDAVTIETEDVAAVQAFIRSIYTDDNVQRSPWDLGDADHATPTPDPPMDTNSNGHLSESEAPADPPNGTGATSPDQTGTENNIGNGSPPEWMTVQGCCPLGTDLLTMYRNKIDTDVLITAQGTQFPAHRAILCARSSYFSAMLSGWWRESSAQEVVLERVSAGVVEQALLFMYGGPAELSPTCDLGELVMVSDMYGISGIKDIAAFILKRDYCHFFHKPCTGCLVGFCETLPITFNFGLEDLHERCLRWNNKHFVRLWPTKPFALLPQEVLDKCCAHLIHDISQVTVLDMLLDVDRLNGAMPQVRWADPVVSLTKRLMDACISHLGNHLANIISTDKFLSLGKTMALGIDMLLDVMRRGVASMPVKCAVQTYLQCRKLVAYADTEDCDWTEDFRSLVRGVYAVCEQFMHHNVHLVVGTDDWTLLSATDQAAIKEGGCFVVPEEAKKPAFKPHPRSTGASRPTVLGQPFQHGARSGHARGAAKTPSPKSPSPAGGSSGGRTPRTPSGKKGGAPGQTRLTPTTPGTKTKTLTKPKSPQAASPRSAKPDAVPDGGAEGGVQPEAAESGAAGSQPEVGEAAQGGACCADLLQEQSGQPPQRPPGKIPVGAAQSKAAGGKKGESTRQARPGSGTKQIPAKTGLPTRKLKSAPVSTPTNPKPARGPETSNGKAKPAKKPASTREPPSSSKTKNDKAAENQKKTQSGVVKNEAGRTRMRPPSAQIPKAKPKTMQTSKDSDRSRTSSGSSQLSSPRSATSGSPRSATSGSRLPIVNKTQQRKTSAQSCKENDAVYAKCTSMRIAAMRRRKPFDADFDIDTESVVSTISHVAVQGSRTPSVMDLDLSPSEFPLRDCNGTSRPSLGNDTDSLDGSVVERYVEVPLCPPQEHNDVIVPVFNAIFSLPDTTKER